MTLLESNNLRTCTVFKNIRHKRKESIIADTFCKFKFGRNMYVNDDLIWST